MFSNRSKPQIIWNGGRGGGLTEVGELSGLFP